jgi:hypothetical protein
VLHYKPLFETARFLSFPFIASHMPQHTLKDLSLNLCPTPNNLLKPHKISKMNIIYNTYTRITNYKPSGFGPIWKHHEKNIYIYIYIYIYTCKVRYWVWGRHAEEAEKMGDDDSDSIKSSTIWTSLSSSELLISLSLSYFLGT